MKIETGFARTIVFGAIIGLIGCASGPPAATSNAPKDQANAIPNANSQLPPPQIQDNKYALQGTDVIETLDVASFDRMLELLPASISEADAPKMLISLDAPKASGASPTYSLMRRGGGGGGGGRGFGGGGGRSFGGHWGGGGRSFGGGGHWGGRGGFARGFGGRGWGYGYGGWGYGGLGYGGLYGYGLGYAGLYGYGLGYGLGYGGLGYGGLAARSLYYPYGGYAFPYGLHGSSYVPYVAPTGTVPFLHSTALTGDLPYAAASTYSPYSYTGYRGALPFARSLPYGMGTVAPLPVQPVTTTATQPVTTTAAPPATTPAAQPAAVVAE